MKTTACAALIVGTVIAGACGGIAFVDSDESSPGSGGATTMPTLPTTTGSSMTTTTTTSTTTTTTGMGGFGGGPPMGGAPPIPPLVELYNDSSPSGTTTVVSVPSAAIGMAVYGLKPNQFASVGIQTLAAPDAFTIIDNYGIAGTLANFDFSGIQTANVPQTDHAQTMPLLSGDWSVLLTGGGWPVLNVWYRQTLDGEFHLGVIDVNVYRIQGVETDQYLTEMVQNAFNGWNGIFPGTINIFTLPDQLSVVDQNNFFDLMAETAMAPGKPVLNVMVVTFIDFPSMPLGFSPGVPGNPLEPGTNQSAVVMHTTGDKSTDALILRHEGSHFAGLFHTSEIESGFGDVLDDTPLCADVMNNPFGCPDVDNIMFPYAGVGTQLVASAKQHLVWQRGPMYRGAVEEGGGVADPLDGSGNNMAPIAPLSPIALTMTRDTSWHESHDPALTKMLSALWCGNTTTSGLDVLELMGVTPATLLSIGSDGRAPPYVRARALAAAGRAGPAPADLQQLLTIAQDPLQPLLVRIGAIEGAAQADAPALRALGLDNDRVPEIAHVARRR